MILNLTNLVGFFYNHPIVFAHYYRLKLRDQIMRLTTRGRYAVTAMLDLALQPLDQTITLAEIAARQTISVAYLEQLFSKLKRRQLVASVRGANGGYHLARAACDITVLEIIEAVNESVDATRCDHKGNCQNGAMCLTHDLWQDLSSHISSYLERISLADLVDRDHVQAVALRQSSSDDLAQLTVNQKTVTGTI
jgi:Rrf2 family iron-sulfur cluster assembly transcriptional regulator